MTIFGTIFPFFFFFSRALTLTALAPHSYETFRLFGLHNSNKASQLLIRRNSPVLSALGESDCEFRSNSSSDVSLALSEKNEDHNTSRRSFLLGMVATTAFFFLPGDDFGNNGFQCNNKNCPPRPQSATAMENPLNLKGTFWETGQLYEKSPNSNILDDVGDATNFLQSLQSTSEALHSPTLIDAITEGRFGDASRLLRGGLISESKIRISAYALIDSIPEDDEREYLASESFRVFLRYLDVLDANVEAASRPRIVGGGGLGDDPRMGVLELLGDTDESLKRFLNIVRGALGG